ncbi:hypothetical protein IC006_2383 [Sulfuracidifex tepidarius]|uniref:Uncharacterized protein n=1 Tax=Sulfuracidifex tepidarius TaxID=1294262 RepID=A0A510DYM4_9CREN|nr:hypothetical protein IC006_2383 [Sulfuracidifex tepidarius]BBG27830.1 hypothetical protein IC007_2385 [Sulfuracidifex tepidarius]
MRKENLNRVKKVNYDPKGTTEKIKTKRLRGGEGISFAYPS